MSINDMHTFSHLSSRGPELPARNSLFIRSLLCTLLVACPAMAEPVTGLDDIKLGADRALRLAVRPEVRCVLGDLDALSLEMKRMAQELRRSGCDQHAFDDRAARQFGLPVRGEEHESRRSQS